LIAFNVIKIHRDKEVKGVSIVPLAFMVLWGFWNFLFYTSVGAMWSFWAGAVCTTVNGVWICQMCFYIHMNKKRDQDGK